MISYRMKMQNGHIMWDAHPVKCRQSDKKKRVYAKIGNYRKTWWHFKTRWDPSD